MVIIAAVLRKLQATPTRLALIACFLLASCPEVRLSGPPRPNAVLISVDCLNQRQFEQAIAGAHAPALARLREDALNYTRAYAHAPWTTPSHMSMLTGLYPNQHGREVPWRLMLKTNRYFDRVPRFPAFPQLLRAGGYEATAFVGKGTVSARFGLAEGFEPYSESAKDERGSDLAPSVERLLEWLDRRGDEPFFLFLHTFDLHLPRPTGIASDRQPWAISTASWVQSWKR